MYGLDLLAPVVNNTTPDITVLVHMHGRSKSAMIEQPLVESLYSNVRGHMTADPAGSKNDFLIVTYDAPDHGNRTTEKSEQGGFETGNEEFGYVARTDPAWTSMR